MTLSNGHSEADHCRIPGENDWVSSSLPDPLVNGVSRMHLNGSTQSHPPLLQSKYPILDRKNDYLGALIKVYDDTSFKPASTHTFIGLLSTAAMPSPLSEDESAESNQILVPAIHVLKVSPRSEPLADIPDPDQIRSDLITHLSTALSVDDISAEYILLALIASPSVRPPALPPLGTLSLNLIGSLPHLSATLRQLVPALVDLPLTLPLLHSTPFCPSSTSFADSSSLSAGLLQLAEGTVLVVDETAMGEGGKLEEKAVKNLQALTECMSEQKLRYEYPYMDGLKMDVWLRPIILSEGKSLVPVDIHLPIQPSPAASSSSSSSSSSTPDLASFRAYLIRHSSSSHAKSLNIPDDIASLIQDDFIALRRSQPSGDAEGVLKRRMKIARLMAVSYADAVLTRERWERVVELDEEAERRIKGRRTQR